MAPMPLVVITGPTASGKSGLGITLGSRFGGEVVSADSRQVYRGLDLGAGKVTPEEQGLVPHHLLDIADVTEVFTLGQYAPLAHTAIGRIHEAERCPFLVGGTGLYVSAVVRNYVLPPVPPNPALRAELERRPGADLFEMLARLDPEATTCIGRANVPRLVRALEVCIQTGLPFSAQRRTGPPLYDVLVLALDWPRTVLHERIDRRVDDRISQGMVDEVRGLLSAGIPPERLHQLGLEYRLISQFLLGGIPTQDEMTTRLKCAIHAFARRQLTWFRRDPMVRWLDPTADCEAVAEGLVRGFLRTSAC